MSSLILAHSVPIGDIIQWRVSFWLSFSQRWKNLCLRQTKSVFYCPLRRSSWTPYVSTEVTLTSTPKFVPSPLSLGSQTLLWKYGCRVRNDNKIFIYESTDYFSYYSRDNQNPGSLSKRPGIPVLSPPTLPNIKNPGSPPPTNRIPSSWSSWTPTFPTICFVSRFMYPGSGRGSLFGSVFLGRGMILEWGSSGGKWDVDLQVLKTSNFLL